MTKPMAIVMAAGKGTRMKSDLPKVLVPACGRPIVHYVVDSLREAGIGKIVAVVGYKQELVRQSLSQFEDIEFVEQTQQLGTGHAVMCCREVLEGHQGPVAVVAGDSPMMQSDSIGGLVKKQQEDGLSCLLGTLNSPDPTGLGRIVREDGVFSGIVEEKDATDQQKQIVEVNMSTYVFDGKELFEALDQIDNNNAQNEYYITDYPTVLKNKGLKVDALPILKEIEALSINTVDQLSVVEKKMQELGMGQSA